MRITSDDRDFSLGLSKLFHVPPRTEIVIKFPISNRLTPIKVAWQCYAKLLGITHLVNTLAKHVHILEVALTRKIHLESKSILSKTVGLATYSVYQGLSKLFSAPYNQSKNSQNVPNIKVTSKKVA